MLKEPLVFVDVDTQHDFLDPGGSLYIEGSESIRPNLARLTAFAREHGIPVIATACAHTPDEPDPEPWPAHCLLGTRGQRRVDETAWPTSTVIGAGETWRGEELPQHLTIHKQRYDVFTHPSADRIMRQFAAAGSTFVVYGVATDYCVKAVVLGLLDRGFRVAVVVDATWAIDQSKALSLLAEFAARGAKLTRTNLVCTSWKE